MPSRRSRINESAAQGQLAEALKELRLSLNIAADFPADVTREAELVVAPSTTPDHDFRDVPFVTIDPEGSLDLDQALHLEHDGSGFIIRYAIADVPGFVSPGGAIDSEAKRRGETIYAADGRIPLHPLVLSEDRVSLLPGKDRSAFVWTFHLDEDGEPRRVDLVRAWVRSRERLTYVEAQRRIDSNSDEMLALLRTVGQLRSDLESRRGGASLRTPEEEIIRIPTGYTIKRRVLLPVEGWNAHISLMTGMAAANIMIKAKVGIIRTLPAPDDNAREKFRLQTIALSLPWVPEIESYGDYLRRLNNDSPAALAVMQAAAGLFRGAGYVAFNAIVPANITQAAIAAPYAHVTAPLRRLVDRWGLVICEAVSNKKEIPEWITSTLLEVPDIMRSTHRVSVELESESFSRVEAALLRDRVGEVFPATVLTSTSERATVQLADPVVTASAQIPSTKTTEIKPGTVINVRLESADIPSGKVNFAVI